MSLKRELLQRISTAGLTIKFLRSYEFRFFDICSATAPGYAWPGTTVLLTEDVKKFET